MLSDENCNDLEVKGYTVVKDVLTSAECASAIGQYREWLAQFKDGDWPATGHSLIHKYNLGHLEPSWFVRLKAKATFSQLWKTDKLLTSVDSVAIGRPPENGEETFHVPGNQWLHVDQSAYKTGLHAYQGAVYLEEACEDDWTFEVMEGSHAHFDQIYEGNPKARKKSSVNNFYRLTEANKAYMTENGCAVKRVPVPKGGMVIWDSRLAHANANPLYGRQNPGRWRYVVFVCMTPAIWADKKDMREKQRANRAVFQTTHWASQGIQIKEFYEGFLPGQHKNISCPKSLPQIAKSDEAKMLAGAMPYDFNDGKPTGIEKKPTWSKPDY